MLRDKKPVIQLLLHATVLKQSISSKLAVAEVFHYFALLLGVTKNLELTAPQVLELVNLFVPRGNSPHISPVAG